MEIVKNEQQGFAESAIAESKVKQLRATLDQLIRGTEGLIYMLIPRWKPGMSPDQERGYAYHRDNPQPHQSLYTAQAELKLKEAKAYSGKLIGLLSGKSTPYKNDGLRKSVQDIEPEEGKLIGVFEVCKISGLLGIHRVDSDLEISSLERVSPVMRIDYLREEVAKLIIALKDIRLEGLRCMTVPGTEVETDDSGAHFAAKALLPQYHEFSTILEIINQKLTEARFHYGFALGEIHNMYHNESTEVL